MGDYIVLTIVGTVVITWIIATTLPLGKEKYYAFIHTLYGSETHSTRPADVAIWFNSILSDYQSPYRITIGETDYCNRIFVAFREHISRIYFDGHNPILDAHREKWVWKNRKRIKSVYRDKSSFLLYLVAEEWLYKHSNDSQICNEKIHDYYDLTEFGATYYKMLLACTIAMESVDEYPPSVHHSKRYEDILSANRINI